MKIIDWSNNNVWVAVSTAVMVSAMFYSFHAGSNMARRYAPLVDAAMEIKLEATTAHLWFEEIISGDRYIDLNNVWRHLDQAAWYARAMLDGGENQEGEILRLEDPELRHAVENTLKGIATFQEIAKERWEKRSRSGVGTSLDQRFDQVFNNFLISADNVETALKRKMNHQLHQFNVLQTTMIVVTLLLGMITGILLHRNASALRRAKEAAEAANKAKSEFLAGMSHDLRTPLNAIMGFSEMMVEHTFGPLGDHRYDGYAKDIRHSGSLLVKLIDDILDLSKIEADKYQLEEEKLDVLSVINSSVKMLNRQAEEKNIRLVNVSNPDVPELLGEEKVLTQLINNLLSNAIKFTPDGGAVTVNAWKSKSSRLNIEVSDTGVGMSKDEISKALNPFDQINSTQARKHEGTGLGLHLCCRFVDLHDGEMNFDSEVNKGTTVTVSFPTERVVANL